MTAQRTLSCDEIRDVAPLFVTGALDADEMTAVRDHLANCDDPHLEMLELGEAAAAMLEAVEPVEPPTAMKSRLMAAAAADLDAGRHPSSARTTTAPVSAPPVVAPPFVAPSNVIDLAAARERRRGRLASLVAVAAVIAVLAMGGWNLGLRQDLGAAQAYRDGVTRALELAAQPGSVTALLAGGDGAVSGLGVIGADGTVRLTVQGLPTTTGTQVYTAWAIEGDGAPVPIGEFTVAASGLATATADSPTAAAGAVLALTLEPSAGATTPSLPIVASGVTASPAG